MEKGEIRINTENIFPIIKKAVYSDHEIFLRELVRFFSPNEKTLNGIGFTISIDVLRNLIKDEKKEKKKILLMFKDSSLLEKGMNEQKVQQKKGNIAVLHLNPCDDLAKANQIMKENNCTEIVWVK